MKTDEFDFNSDGHTMPSDPVELRGRSRDSGKMVVLDRSSGKIEHSEFSTICDHLRPGDLLVLNDSYMLSNTLSFQHGDGVVDVIVYGHEPDDTTIVRLHPAQQLSAGTTLSSIDDEQLTCTFLELQSDGMWKVRFDPAERLIEALDRFGRRVDETLHLDPEHWRKHPKAYHSVYAKKPGSLETPSAGLHFSQGLLDHISSKGVELAYITLHVGATETLAVRHISADEIENHEVRPEYFEIDSKVAAQISRALAEGRRIVAVGTTVLRTLESLTVNDEADPSIPSQTSWTDLYIYPGFRFKIVDALLTNLHRPRSSHIVLTAAFGGKDLVMKSYEEILDNGEYEFDMFGDSMLIV